jgi:hypothetical protein
MSRDQKPGKATIVVNAASRGGVGPGNGAAGKQDPNPTKLPVVLLAALFLISCIVSGIAFVLLPGLLR